MKINFVVGAFVRLFNLRRPTKLYCAAFIYNSLAVLWCIIIQSKKITLNKLAKTINSCVLCEIVRDCLKEEKKCYQRVNVGKLRVPICLLK